MAPRDILDDGAVTIAASPAEILRPWVSSVGSDQVVLSGTYQGTSLMQYYIQESRDGTNVVQEFNMATLRTHIPASAFVRVVIRNPNPYEVPVEYSLRSLGSEL